MTKFVVIFLAVVIGLTVFVGVVDATTFCVSSGVGPGAATAGSDSNNGIGDGSSPASTCFASLERLFDTTKATFLHGADTAIFRVGEYNTAWTGVIALTTSGEVSIIPSGTDAAHMTTFLRYGTEKPVWRRYLPNTATHTEQQLQSSLGAHMPTQQECIDKANQDGVAPHSFPWGCWSNDGFLQPGDQRIIVNEDIIDSHVMTISALNDNPYDGPFVQYIKFDGITFDAKGIVKGVLQLDMTARHLIFNHYELAYGIFGCNSNPVSSFDVNDSDRSLILDWQFLNGHVHHCGVPYDTNLVEGVLAREHPAARFYQSWYLHAGGVVWDNNEIDHIAGACASPLGKNNTFRNNYCHDNNPQALIISGYPISHANWQIYNNLFVVKDTCMQFSSLLDAYVFNNTCVSTRPDNATGIYIEPGVNTAGDLRIENNIIYNFQKGIFNDQNVGNSTVTIRNNLVKSNQSDISSSGNTQSLSNNITGIDPQFNNPSLGDYTLKNTSPAIDAGILDSTLPATGDGNTAQQATDFNGAPRPVGPAIDIGYVEFGASLGPTAPNTLITSRTTDGSTPLNDPSTATTAQFAFAGTGGTDGNTADTSYTFQCQIDGGAFGSCTSPKSYSSLTLIQHTFCVKATGNNSGLTDASPACFSWTVQTNAPPDTTINTASPASTTTDTTASFTFSASGCVGTCTFQCSIDQATFVTCTSPQSYSGLQAQGGVQTGQHNFRVRATDDGTNLTDPSPAQYNWTILPPSGGGAFDIGTCVQIVKPGCPTWNLRDSWPNGAINFAACFGDIEIITNTSPATNQFGFTGLEVTDLTGSNVGLSGKWHSTDPFGVAAVACPGGSDPNTSIDSGPSGTTNNTNAMFTFSGSGGQSPYTFQCQLDGGGFAACTSPQNYTGLATTSHTFDVKAIGADARVDPTPATQSWTINAATAIITQSASRFYGLRNLASGAQQQLGTTTLQVVKGGKFTVGIEIESSVANPAAQGLLLYYSKNGGSYTAVPDTCGADHICFYGVADASTDIKSDGSGLTACEASSNTAVGGAISRRSASILTFALPITGCVELRWILKFDGSETAGDTYDFRARHTDTTVIDAYTVTPRVTTAASQSSGI